MAAVPIDNNRVTYFAETDARNRRLKFGIKAEDRTRHVYVIGKTGMGKSTLLENMAAQDIQNGEGMCFIDPHGKTADLLLEYVPKERINDVIYIAPFDTEYPISFNVLESVDPNKRHLVAGGLMSTFKKIWEDAWSARMEYILTNTLLALLEAPNTTLLGVNRMLSDKAYRNEIISHVTDPSVKSFWVKEFANYTERMAAEAVPAIQNKVGQFTANPLIRNMIGQPTSSFDFRRAMDERKIIIINLSKGRIGDENMKLLGGLLVTKIYLAAMSRADVPDRVMKMLPNFYLFVDEFQNFANASFADILSEARKYKLNLTIAHQYIEQMDEIVRPAVFGNVGTMISFRVGATDGEQLEKEFAPAFTVEDLVNLGKYQLYLKLMIDGLSSSPFSATTLPPIAHPDRSYMQEIIEASRHQFAKPRAEIELEIVKFHDSTPGVPAKKVDGAPKSYSNSPAPAAAPKAAPVAASVPAPAAQAPVAPKPAPVVAPTPSAPASVSTPISKPTPAPSARPKPLASPVPAALTPVPPKPATPTAPVSPVTPPAAPSTSTFKPKPTPAPAPQAAPIPNPAPAPAPVSAPMAVPAPKIQPVSLTSLARPSRPAQDPKIPSAKNVSDLKSALAAALNKNKPASPVPQQSAVQANQNPVQAPVQKPVSVPTPAAQPAPQVDSHDDEEDDFMPLESLKGLASIPKAPVVNIAEEPPASQQTPVAEVPEQVLRDVLKM